MTVVKPSGSFGGGETFASMVSCVAGSRRERNRGWKVVKTTTEDYERLDRVFPARPASVADMETSLRNVEGAIADILLLLSQSFQQQEIMLGVIRDGNRVLRKLCLAPVPATGARRRRRQRTPSGNDA